VGENSVTKELTEFDLIAIEDPRAKTFQCPHCDAKLQFKVQVNVHGVYEINDDNELLPKPPPKPAPVKDRFTPEERALLESLRAAGLYAAFEAAARASMYTNVKDMERYLLTFLQSAVPVKSPQFAIRQCLPEDEASGDLELWQLNTVVAVIADGEIRAFFPVDLVKGRPLRTKLQSDGKTITAGKENVTVTDWVKTRNGYVAGRGLLFKELRGKAAGAFANTGI
jgi:hypothetical protein